MAAEHTMVLTVVEPTSIPTRNPPGAEAETFSSKELLPAGDCELEACLTNPYSILPFAP